MGVKKGATKETGRKIPEATWYTALSAIAEGATLAEAAAHAAIHISTIWRWQKDCPLRRKEYMDAVRQAADILETGLMSRAIHGVRRMKFDKGAAIIDPVKREENERALWEGRELPHPHEWYVEVEHDNGLGFKLLACHKRTVYDSAYRSAKDARRWGREDAANRSATHGVIAADDVVALLDAMAAKKAVEAE